MTEPVQIGNATLYCAASEDVLPTMPENSADSIVTDPPYGLGFMGKKWDIGVPAVELFRECLRVLKPGGHLLAFGGARTYHRLAVAVEDAGFEIRDQIMWIFGSGFPKSRNVGREVEEYDGWGTALKPSSEPLVCAQKPSPDTDLAGKIGSKLNVLESELWSMLSANIAVEHFGLSLSEYDAACAGAQWTADEKHSTWAALCARMDTSQFVSVASTSLSIVQSWRSTLAALWNDPSTFITGTESNTTIDWKTLKSCASTITPRTIIQAAMSPDGWIASAGPAERYFNAELSRLSAILELSARAFATGNPHIDYPVEGASPHHRPIVMARKPLDGTVAANVQRHGTGAINVDGCRVEGEPTHGSGRSQSGLPVTGFGDMGQRRVGVPNKINTQGRWPANVIHDGSEEVVSLFPDTKSGHMKAGTKRAAQDEPGSVCYGTYGGDATSADTYADAGSAARFFYCAKASRKDRNEGCEALAERPLLWSSGTQSPGTFQAEGTKRAANNNHPTVKPTDLMRYLCRLVTPPGGMVLDPFMGSGSTGKAAILEGFAFIGIDKDVDYFHIGQARIDNAQRQGRCRRAARRNLRRQPEVG